MEKTDLGGRRGNMRTNGGFGAGMSKSFHIMDQTSARPLTQHRIPEMSQYKNKSFNSTSVFFIAEAALYL